MKCKVDIDDVDGLKEEEEEYMKDKDKDKILEKENETRDNNKLPKLFDALLYSYMAWATASSVIIFLFVIIYIITLGSFDDFRELQNLMPSLLIAVLALFLLEAAYKYVLRKAQYDTRNRDNIQPNTNDQILSIINNAILSVRNNHSPKITNDKSSLNVDE